MNLTRLLFLWLIIAKNGYSQMPDEGKYIYSTKLYASFDAANDQTIDEASMDDDYVLLSDSAKIIFENDVFYYLEFWPDGSLKKKAEVEPFFARVVVRRENLESGDVEEAQYGEPYCRIKGEILEYQCGDSIPKIEEKYRCGKCTSSFELTEKYWDRKICRTGGQFYYVGHWPNGKLKIRAQVEPCFAFVGYDAWGVDLHNNGKGCGYEPSFRFHGVVREYNEDGNLVRIYNEFHGRP